MVTGSITGSFAEGGPAAVPVSLKEATPTELSPIGRLISSRSWCEMFNLPVLWCAGTGDYVAVHEVARLMFAHRTNFY